MNGFSVPYSWTLLIECITAISCRTSAVKWKSRTWRKSTVWLIATCLPSTPISSNLLMINFDVLFKSKKEQKRKAYSLWNIMRWCCVIISIHYWMTIVSVLWFLGHWELSSLYSFPKFIVIRTLIVEFTIWDVAVNEQASHYGLLNGQAGCIPVKYSDHAKTILSFCEHNMK